MGARFFSLPPKVFAHFESTPKPNQPSPKLTTLRLLLTLYFICSPSMTPPHTHKLWWWLLYAPAHRCSSGRRPCMPALLLNGARLLVPSAGAAARRHLPFFPCRLAPPVTEAQSCCCRRPPPQSSCLLNVAAHRGGTTSWAHDSPIRGRANSPSQLQTRCTWAASLQPRASSNDSSR